MGIVQILAYRGSRMWYLCVLQNGLIIKKISQQNISLLKYINEIVGLYNAYNIIFGSSCTRIIYDFEHMSYLTEILHKISLG